MTDPIYSDMIFVYEYERGEDGKLSLNQSPLVFTRAELWHYENRVKSDPNHLGYVVQNPLALNG